MKIENNCVKWYENTWIMTYNNSAVDMEPYVLEM